MTDKLTLEDLIGFAGDDARPGEIETPFVRLSSIDDKRLADQAIERVGYSTWVFKNGIDFEPCPSGSLSEGSMVLLDANNTEIRRHNPGDRKYWRDK
jgi:hypothetical protein